MGYFDDITFFGGCDQKQRTEHIDRQFPDLYSVQLLISGRMYFGFDHQPSEQIEGPTFFWIHPAHQYQYGPVDTPVERLVWICFRGERGRRILVDGFVPICHEAYRPAPNPAKMIELFERLLVAAADPLPIGQAHAVVYLESILAELLTGERTAEAHHPHADGIARLAETIHHDPTQSIDFAAESKRLCLSYTHFRRLFRQYVGRSPHDYLLYCRMQTAAALLQQPNRQVKDVAMQLGYDDPAQFTKLFKKKIGLSPLASRSLLH